MYGVSKENYLSDLGSETVNLSVINIQVPFSVDYNINYCNPQRRGLVG